ncbi:3-deoxy-D-manno-octulosonic acid transferase [Donghicola sp. C2-DW-16]|uniref:3-deoxy-D-manno-octulosonic acid transferase n=1 Tax=Donghicola mangrovi TaxID=2729614 RepID=A0ABX2PIQ1_9RHOB|nr:glycosyltransferase N-terminal domain-containing protein [Donghicola mangrovi]NVO28429.1 3-deoxy-D-manno-octulosonic acid transferase [Donghicola mangrovi]
MRHNLLAYRIAISALAPILTTLFAVRTLRGQEDSAALSQRFGLGPTETGPSIWLHGASNGELHSARPLIEDLREARPDLGIVVTTNTVTGRDMVNGWQIAGVCAYCAPLDLRATTNSFLTRHHIVALISLENELWPNRIVETARRGLPVCLISAKISRKSAKIWKRMPGLRAKMFSSVSMIAPQDRGSRNRFKALGIRERQLAPIIELKSLYRAAEGTPPALPKPRHAIWLAASTHEGEEEQVLDAQVTLAASDTAPLLILAPRHPRRAPEIRAMIEARGLTCAQRSRDEQPTPETQVYLVDTMGEMPMWYRAAAATFVAGSLVDKGGHTPFEPAAYDTGIIHGWSSRNFQRIYRDLDTSGGAIRVTNAAELAEAVATMLENPDHYIQSAQQVISQTADLAPLVARILTLLPSAPQE